jgi:hypothetical protein
LKNKGIEKSLEPGGGRNPEGDPLSCLQKRTAGPMQAWMMMKIMPLSQFANEKYIILNS